MNNEEDYEIPCSFVRKAVSLALGLVSLLLAANVLTWYAGGQILPKLGCEIVEQHGDIGTLAVWIVRAWHTTDEGKFIALMSEHPAEDKHALEKSTKDCTQWMKNPQKFLLRFKWHKAASELKPTSYQ